MKTWKDLSPDAKALILGGACIAAGYSRFRKVVRVERRKRKQIEEWKQNQSAAAKAARARLDAMADDPTVSANEFITAAREEMRFLKVIGNIPMYD